VQGMLTLFVAAAATVNPSARKRKRKETKNTYTQHNAEREKASQQTI